MAIHSFAGSWVSIYTIQREKETVKLLITGIPGAGKTHFGEYLVSAHGFVHRDLEDTTEFADFVDNPLTYLLRLSAEGQKSVITWSTWGFVPAIRQIELVRSIGKHGFGILWFEPLPCGPFRAAVPRRRRISICRCIGSRPPRRSN